MPSSCSTRVVTWRGSTLPRTPCTYPTRMSSLPCGACDPDPLARKEYPVAQPQPDSSIQVRLVTAHNCHLCDHARSVLARLQAEIPLAIEVVSLESPQGQTLA